jgi:molecular chaperone GrpE
MDPKSDKKSGPIKAGSEGLLPGGLGKAKVPTEVVESPDGLEEENSLEEWRDRALRLQAEMENFRKRQRRLTEEAILADRERLLRSMLQVADDLERALKADGMDAENLRQGVDLTYQTLKRLLEQEGVKPLQSQGQPFDPAWHEAVGSVPHQVAGIRPNTVVEVDQEGYSLGARLLRPARVLVAD